MAKESINTNLNNSTTRQLSFRLVLLNKSQYHIICQESNSRTNHR